MSIPSERALKWPTCMMSPTLPHSENQSVVILAPTSFANEGNDNRLRQSCKIYSDQAIFIPVYDGECDTGMAGFESAGYAKLLECAKRSNTSPNPKISVDGQDISNEITEQYVSKLFKLTIPKENPYLITEPLGTFDATGGGFYILLEPFNPGIHEIRVLLRSHGRKGERGCNL